MSIFKRLFGDKDDYNHSNSAAVFKAHVNNASIKSMGSNLQKRFARGVQYNMKIVIRGDRNVGKSALLARLKGLDFCDQYIPTDEIEVACIHWNYKSNDDVVKVEVWDVVDKGRKKKQSGLKLENISTNEENSGSMCLDAEFLDVYKGAHAVIMVLDITKSWTLNYVERELQFVPENIPVLVLANHRDMGSHRTVSTDQVQTLIESVPSYKSGIIKYWESSMKNGYGLIYIHRFFNIPFLQLQKDTLLKQLATNEQETKSALKELEDLEEEPDSLYDNFITNLKQSKVSNSQHQKPTSLSLHSNPVSQINSPNTPASIPQVPVKSSLTPMSDHPVVISDRIIHPPQARPIPGMEKLGLYPLPVPTEIPVKCNNMNGTGDTVDLKNHDKKDIDEFIPEEHPELSSFLDECSLGRSPNAVQTDHLDSSSDDNDGRSDTAHNSSAKRKQNPMVAAFQDDIDSDDVVNIDQPVVNCTFMNDTASSDDDINPYRLPTVASASQLGVVSKRSSPGSSTILGSKSDVNITNLTANGDKYNDTDAPPPEFSFTVPSVTNPTENDFNPDETVFGQSGGAVKKKKKKKHHKDSSTKEHQSKKKKNKSKNKSRESSPSNNGRSSPRDNHRKESQTSRKSEDRSSPDRDDRQSAISNYKSDRSDSLERFLNG